VSAPLVPVMVTFEVPVVAVADAVKVITLLAKVAVTPVGRALAANVTLPLNPLTGVTVIVLVALPPWVTDTLAGFAEREKSGWPLVTPREMVVVRERAPLVPVMVMVAMPVVAVLDALKVTTLPAKLAVTPVGIPLALKATLPLKPPPVVTVIVLLADFP